LKQPGALDFNGEGKERRSSTSRTRKAASGPGRDERGGCRPQSRTRMAFELKKDFTAEAERACLIRGAEGGFVSKRNTSEREIQAPEGRALKG